MTIELKDKLYTSTEVANILGVSLRSVYRYLDEGKLNADVKTATGRHRFSKQNILDFLYPSDTSETPKKEISQPDKALATKKKLAPEPVQEVTEDDEEINDIDLLEDESLDDELSDELVADDQEEPESSTEETVDWLAKFRAAAEKYREEQSAKVPAGSTGAASAAVASDVIADNDTSKAVKTETVDSFVPEEELEEEPEEEKTEYYYLSGVGGLKEIAQSLDKAAKKASVDYAFTLDAGLSLFKPIRPFSVIHAYVRSSDRDYFEKALKLTEVSKSSAQLCLYISDENDVYKDKREMYGLNVVSRDRLRMDLVSAGEKDLVSELDTIA